jgi:hypothetical protein
MSDRKYRQRGYMDEGRTPARDPNQKPATRSERPEGPRTPNMPGFQTVIRCHRCGHLVNAVILAGTSCVKCGAPLHCCAQCESFNPASRYECMQTISARVSPKDAFNTCSLFEARTKVERETGSVRQTTARSAFDDLFKI